MAKKKAAKKKGGKKKNGSSKSKGIVNTNKLIGMAAAAFINAKLIPKIPGTGTLDPKIIAGGKVLGGEWLQNQDFVKKAITNDDMRKAGFDSLQYEGVKELMSAFGISGLKRSKPKGNEFLAVSIEGLEDPEKVGDDILANDDLGDDLDTVNDDLDTVNDDDMGEEDEYDIGDDLDTVNEDVMADDEMNDDVL